MKFDDNRTNSAPVVRSTDALFSLTAALAWGVMFPVAAGMLDHIDAVNLTALRYIGASAIFLGLLWWREGRRAISYSGRFLSLFWLGSLGFAGFNLLAYVALAHTAPQNAALIVATTPLVTVMVRWIRDGVRPSGAVLGLILVALLGVSMVLGKGDPSLVLRGGLNLGDLLVFLAVICWVLYSLGAARHAELSPLRYTALTASAGLITILAITAVTDLTGLTSLPTGSDVAAEIPSLFYVILGGGVLAVLCWNEGIRRIGPAAGSLFMNLVPVTAFAIQIGRGYHASVGELAGAVVTIVAIVAANRVTARAAARAAADERSKVAEAAPPRPAHVAGRTVRR
jgi:drug/metabolite transporter (DMT)-like permease